MGRKLYVALLLSVHLSFIACAVLIAGPLMTEEGDQEGDKIAVSQAKLGDEVSTGVSAQENGAEVQFQKSFADQRRWQARTLDLQRLNRWGRAGLQSRDGPRSHTRKLAP